MTKIEKTIIGAASFVFLVVVLCFSSMAWYLGKTVILYNNSHYIIREERQVYFTDNYTEEDGIVKFKDKMTDRDVVLRGYDSIETQ